MKLSVPPADIGNPRQFATHPCKICGTASPPFDVTDFNKTCELLRDPANLAGIPVYYNFCSHCEFLFTTFCDTWSVDDFGRYIYNAEYDLVDPECAEERPLTWAARFATILEKVNHPDYRLLDYGAGSGRMAKAMSERGFHTATFDLFTQPQRPDGKFDIITCCEVIEHAHDPFALLTDMASLLTDDGMILFTTGLLPSDIAVVGARWWYVGPRNGHVSIFSLKSLATLGQRCALNLQAGEIDGNIIMLYRRRPLESK
jgi:2-polyprenyl-6-hydroxyphenyl methylase/3-demethylubiquinone-9 3-methyltransferase